MKILKTIGFILLGIIVVALIAGLILPKKINIERTITISAPADSVFSQVSHFHKMNKWSPWSDYDPNMKVSYEGTDGQIGAKSKWEGNKNAGKGYQEIVSLDKNKRIDVNLVFEEPWEAQSDIYYLFNASGNNIKVTWGYNEKTPFPKNLLFALFGMKKALKKDFDKGLSRLKEVCEG